jgi:hypothetical protein
MWTHTQTEFAIVSLSYTKKGLNAAHVMMFVINVIEAKAHSICYSMLIVVSCVSGCKKTTKCVWNAGQNRFIRNSQL